MKYASPVAYIHAGQIRFGVVKEIIHRENAKGITTEWIVQSEDAREAALVTNGEHIVEIEPDYPSLIGDRVAKLFDFSTGYQWALDTSRDLIKKQCEPIADNFMPVPMLVPMLVPVPSKPEDIF